MISIDSARKKGNSAFEPKRLKAQGGCDVNSPGGDLITSYRPPHEGRQDSGSGHQVLLINPQFSDRLGSRILRNYQEDWCQVEVTDRRREQSFDGPSLTHSGCPREDRQENAGG